MADPGAHKVEVPTAVERDHLPGDLVDELPAFLVEDTLVPEVGAPADAQERLVDVGALEIICFWWLFPGASKQ